MLSNEIISIIIPCYNSSQTIERCLISIEKQTHKCIQVIIADDGSTDDTIKKCEKYKNKFFSLKILQLSHKGVSHARNKALQVADGKYIQFIDSDDNYICANALEKSLTTLKKYDVDAVVFDFIHPCFSSYLPEGYYELTNEETLLEFYQDFFSLILPWNKLFRREVLTLPFNEEVAFAEDELFNLSNLKNIKSIYVLSDVFYNYYCAPATEKGNLSAINKTFLEGDFLSKKKTIWYNGVENSHLRKNVCEKYFPKTKDFMLNVRTFDYFFWNFLFMCNVNVSHENAVKECLRIFNEKEFVLSLKAKQSFGLKYKRLNDNELLNSIKTFCKKGKSIFNKSKASTTKINVYFELSALFATLFFDYDIEKLNVIDVTAKALLIGLKTV